MAAVSEAGGLGSGYMTPETIRGAISEIRSLTDRPFAVNLFIPEQSKVMAEEVQRVNDLMAPFRKGLGIEVPD